MTKGEPMTPITDKPLAAKGLTSYRYRGWYGWIMIGAKDVSDALREAGRSTDEKITTDNLQVWDGNKYTAIHPSPEDWAWLTR
jgi:hypothetical protein